MAEALGCNRTTVVNWQKRGVSAQAWPAFAALCRDHGVHADDTHAVEASRRLLAAGRGRGRANPRAKSAAATAKPPKRRAPPAAEGDGA